MTIDIDKKYLNTYEAADYFQDQGLQITSNTLRTLISRGGGPNFYKWGRSVRYTKETLDAWIDGRMSGLKMNSLDKGGYNA